MLTGCGDSGKDSASADNSPTKLLIGIGAPVTQGDVGQGKGIERGALLAVQRANASQEVKDLGITFVTSTGDDQSDPKVGTTVANSFASKRNLLGVVGHFNSTVSIAASKVYNDKKIIMISPGSTNPTLTEQGFASIFRTTATDAVQGPVGAERAIALGYKSAVVVSDSSTYGDGLSKAFAAKFIELGGTVSFTTKTQQKQNDFTTLSTKIASLKPEVVYFGGTYAADTGAGALFSKQLKSAGVTAPVLGGDGLYDVEYITLAGNAEGDLTTSPGLPTELLPKGAEFAQDFKAAYPNDSIAAFDAYAYDAAQAIINATIAVAKEKGVSQLNTPDGKSALISAVAQSNFDGVTGNVSFDEKGDNKNRAITLYKVEGGKWVPQPTK
jgi:branched-chain amino acid transport system substrate-binding protein